MKKLMVLLIFFMMVPAFGAYRLVLKNGAVLELVKKPDFSGKRVTAETLKGKKIIFPTRFVDMAATEQANLKKPVHEKVMPPVHKTTHPVCKKPVSSPPKEVVKHRVPLVITNETVKRGIVSEAAADEKNSEADKNQQAENGNTTLEEEPGMSTGIVDDNGHGEDYWREKFEENKELQAGVLKDLKKMQLKMNAMMARRLQTDDEMEKRALAGKMQKLQKLIDNAKAHLQKLKKSKEKLLDEARTSGALPGWYRDYED
ncbi:MAG: hypothetical protein GXO69_09580 [Acidobacteria bacterium]|nr:hypothetical protein [Acidobacteriota bacterium]